MPRIEFQFSSRIAVAVLIAVLLLPAAAQEPSPVIVRIVELTSTRYLWYRAHPRLTIPVDQFRLGSPELRRGSATDDQIKRVDELLQEPEIRNAGTTMYRFPMMVMPDGKAILVLGRIEGKTRVVEFNDIEGKKSTPTYLKGFEAFARDVRRSKLPKSPESGTANCKPPTH